MMSVYVLNELGEPVEASAGEAGALLGDIERRRVGVTEDDNRRVSTVFTVIGYPSHSGPYVFETLTELSRLSVLDERYRTLQEAVDGHKAEVQRVWGDEAPPTTWGPLVCRPVGDVEEPTVLGPTVWERLLGESVA